MRAQRTGRRVVNADLSRVVMPFRLARWAWAISDRPPLGVLLDDATDDMVRDRT